MKQPTSTLEPLPEAVAPSADGRDARWNQHRDQRRHELIRAARKAIHRGGAEVPMDEIAAAAGTSKSVFYRYFGGKDGLRKAVGADVIEQLRAAVLGAADERSGPRAALSGMIRAYLVQVAASPNTYAFVVADGDDRAEGLNAFRTELVDLMGERLQGLIGRELPPLSASSLSLWPAAAIGTIRAAGERWLAQSSATRPHLDTLTTELTAWLLDGVLAANATSEPNPARKDR